MMSCVELQALRCGESGLATRCQATAVVHETYMRLVGEQEVPWLTVRNLPHWMGF